MFWDGDRWVDERAYAAQRDRAAKAARPSGQRPDSSAAGIVVVAIIALFALGVPFVGAAESAPSVVVSPDAGPAGTVTDVYVSGLEPRTRAFLTWDGNPIPGSDFRAGKDGVFEIRFRIPAGPLGAHSVAVAAREGGGRPTARTTNRLASTTFTIDAAAPDPEPTRRPEPTDPPTPDPTRTPTDPPATQRPDPTREPTPEPTPEPTREPTPEPTPDEPDPTPDPTPAACDGSLQSLVNAAPNGSVLDLTGCEFSGGATISKPLTLVGATITTGRSREGVIVTANNVTLRGLRIIGPQASTYDGSEVGIEVRGSAASPVYNLVIRDSVLRRFGYGGMHVRYVRDFTIRDNLIEDGVYAGIMVLSGVNGQISGNRVERIGVVGAGANGNNAYGIALTQAIASSPRSTDITVSGNTVLNVPTWHGLDTHGGARITWTDNIVKGCRDGIFITGWPTNRALDNVIEGNRVEDTSNSNQYGITSVYSSGGLVAHNTIAGWMSGHAILTTSGGDPVATAVNLTVSGNNIEP